MFVHLQPRVLSISSEYMSYSETSCMGVKSTESF